jgi:phenylacetate-CoA ligase
MTVFNVVGRKLPASIKPFLKKTLFRWIPLRWRMGRQYWRLRSFLSEAQWWEQDRIKAWQLEKMQEIVRFAYEHVTGYRQLYQEAGFHPNDLQTLADVASLPIVSRALLQDNIEAFSVQGLPPWQIYQETTGGSSGTPLSFYRTKASLSVENAFVHTHWGWAGWPFGSRSTVLRGPLKTTADQLWDYDPVNRELYLSTFRLNTDTYPQFKQKIHSFNAPNLQAYASTATLLADLILEAGDAGLAPFERILLGAEGIQDWQIALLEKAFPGAKIAGHYGLTEQAIIGAWCEYTQDYHINPYYSLTEYVQPETGIFEESGLKELVGTSFWNRATPFIRYRTGDLAIRQATRCESCGRHFDILAKIEGRTGEYVVGSNGNLFSLTSLIFAQHFQAFSAIQYLQIVQTQPGEVLVRVVPTKDFSERNKAEIITRMEKAARGKLAVRLEKVDKITRTRRGKNQFLIQDLDIHRPD